MTLVWVNGRGRRRRAATVAVLDHGFTVGDGVFETCKVLDGRSFALTRHLRRLARSAPRSGSRTPADDVVRAGCGRAAHRRSADRLSAGCGSR